MNVHVARTATAGTDYPFFTKALPQSRRSEQLMFVLGWLTPAGMIKRLAAGRRLVGELHRSRFTAPAASLLIIE
jgi:hypothetical protein